MVRTLRMMLLSLFHTLRSRWSRGPLVASWSVGMEVIVRFLRRDWEETASWSFPRLRAESDASPYPTANVRKVEIRDGELGGVPARWFVPPGAPAHAAVLFFHGGSYIYGSARTTHADLIARLALRTGLTAIGLEYRLAPEHPYPAQLDDAHAAVEALRATGVEKIVVAGDSAGGNLALMLQIRLRDAGEGQAAGCVLISPWSDLTMPAASFQENDPYDYGTREVLLVHARAFAGDVPLDDPRISPVHADLKDLAPVFLLVGSREIPRDDILALGERLEAAGVDVVRHLATDLPHNPPFFADYHPSGAASVDGIVDFIRARVKEPAGAGREETAGRGVGQTEGAGGS